GRGGRVGAERAGVDVGDQGRGRGRAAGLVELHARRRRRRGEVDLPADHAQAGDGAEPGRQQGRARGGPVGHVQLRAGAGLDDEVIAPTRGQGVAQDGNGGDEEHRRPVRADVEARLPGPPVGGGVVKGRVGRLYV